MHRKAVSIVVLCLAFCLNVAADEVQDVQGELNVDGVMRVQDLVIELRSEIRGFTDRAGVMADGRFNFRGIASGNYRLVITTLTGDVLKEEFVSISPSNGGRLVVQFKAPSQNNTGPASVSLRRLSHKPPKEAVKEWKEASKCAGRGDHQSAVSHLERSVALDPEYFDAQFHLGGEKLSLGDAEGALAAYEKTLEIDPLFAPALVSRGIVLLHFKRTEEAEESARKALTISDSESAHYVLGLSLALQNEDIPKAIEHLKLSEARHPQAKKTVDYLESRMKTRPSGNLLMAK